MSLDKIIEVAQRDLRYHKDTFVQEIVDEYYDDALIEAEGDPEEAAAVAVDKFYHDMAYGRASNMWKVYAAFDMKPEELLKDPRVQTFDFDKLDAPPKNLQEALVAVVGYLTYQGIWRMARGLEEAVLDAVTAR